MKNLYIIIIVVLTMSFLLIPLLATGKGEVTVNSTNTSNIESDEVATFKNLSEIKLYLTDEDRILNLKKEEYVLGVVAAEMSAENHIEALKAQALAAYTYAYRKHFQNSKTDCEYDLTNDPNLDQRYIDEVGRKTKWGDKFSEYESKIKQAIFEISDELIVYNSEPILAVYHAISSGKTETAKNVWGTDYPYLQSENSVGDLLSADFYSELVVDEEDFVKKLTELEVEITGENKNIIGKVEKSTSGTVLYIELFNKKITGSKIRETFGLRSSAFEVTYKNNSFVFTVSGYGHGVGMSQFGANYLAQQGSSYEEIIETYYRGSEIVNLTV